MEMSTKSLENTEKGKDESFRKLELALSILELFSLDYVLCCILDMLPFCLRSVFFSISWERICDQESTFTMILQIDSAFCNISHASTSRKEIFALESHFSDKGLMFLYQTDLSHINFLPHRNFIT